MYKKPVQTSGEHAVSNSDRKQLRRALAARFGACDATLDALLPSKADLRVAKVASPSRASIYLMDGVPLLVDVSSKGDIHPSLYALWRAPELLPALTLRHADVASFLLGGADLMAPGVAQPLPADLVRGRLYAVFAPGVPQAVCVGEALLSSADVAAGGGKGRLLANLHHFGDCLCEKGAAAAGAEATPPGFSAGGVLRPPVTDDAEPSEPPLSADEALPPPADEDAPSAAAAAAASPELPPKSAAEAMDALLDCSLLQALRKHIKDRDLPLACGKLLQQHILPARPAGTSIDVKSSTYRQLKTFLLAKEKQGLLRLKSEPRTGELSLVGVTRSHPALLGHVPHVEHDAGDGGDAENKPQPLHAEELLSASANTHTRALLAAAGCEAEGAMSAEEAAAGLHSYLEQENLTARGSTLKRCLLDPLLTDALFSGGGGGERPSPLPTELPTSEIAPLFLARLAPMHRLWRGDEEPPAARRGALPTLKLAHESRAGGRNVTVVGRLEPFGIPPQALAAELKALFAASCAVTELVRPAGLAARAATPCELVLQGERAAGVAAHLVERWGLPPRCAPLPPGVKPLKKKG